MSEEKLSGSKNEKRNGRIMSVENVCRIIFAADIFCGIHTTFCDILYKICLYYEIVHIYGGMYEY